jgi:glyoxylase I family protein
MQLKGIHHIALNVKDLDRAERFYTDVLGFQVTHRFSKGLRHLMLETGNAAIALFEALELEVKEAMNLLSEEGYLHLAFEADPTDFESIVKELQSKNIDIGNGPVKRGDGESIYLNDPDDNHLEIHCDNPND